MSTAANDIMVYQMGSDGRWHWRLIPWASASAAVALSGAAVPQLSPISSFATSAQGAKADSALQSQVQSDWNSAIAPTAIQNKPTLGTAAAQNTAAFDAAGAAATAQAFAIQRSNQTGTQAANTITGLGVQMVADTGWTAATATPDKTVVLENYTNGLNGTMVTALNVVSGGTGTALSAALDTISLLVKEVAALRAALLVGKLPNV